MLVQALLLANDIAVTHRLRNLLEPVDVAVSCADTKGNFWDRVAQATADLIIVARDTLPLPIADTLQSLSELPHEPDTIVLWDEEDAEERANLLAAGCYAVLNTELADDTLREALVALIDRLRMDADERAQAASEATEYLLSDFDTKSPAMLSFMRTVRRVVQADSSLLVLGETGVGKERLARAIHDEGPRRDGPFIAVNCAAFPESLLEAELFGHDEGAFTGAMADRRGYFELAHGGTLFLDEIGEVARHVQVKLLRVLQERCIQRLGGEETIPIDVRIVAATNRDLDEEIKARRFRRDLYYRLSVVTLEVPSLRDHPDDIPQLLERYLSEFRVTLGRNIRGFSPAALDALGQYAWPGNVRELINVVERAALLCEGEEITLGDLPPGLGESSHPESVSAPESAGHPWIPDTWREMPWSQLRRALLSACEHDYLVEQLKAARGRPGLVARQAKLNPRSLYAMMKRHGLGKEQFRDAAPGAEETGGEPSGQ